MTASGTYICNVVPDIVTVITPLADVVVVSAGAFCEPLIRM
jgi:hypothetical protein